MSTRSCIARKTKSGFNGRYHHWDGYPTGLGATLYKLYNEHFKRNLDRMLEVLIDEHQAGWSTICTKNFKKKPGWIEYTKMYRKHTDPQYKTNPVSDDRPICYCHGDRSEPKNDVNEKNAAACGCEYAYIFAMETKIKGKGRKEPVMHVYSSYHLGGDKMIGFFGYGDENAVWIPVGRIFLNDPEPDWDSMCDKKISLPKMIMSLLKGQGVIFPNPKEKKAKNNESN